MARVSPQNKFFENDLAKQRYLVVDDFGDMRSMMKSMLHLFGASKIDAVASGEEAIAALDENQYDIILCDYNLGPNKDGQQVLEEGKHRRLIKLTTLFVMVTAENTRSVVMAAVEHEPDNYLSKPFTKDLLKSRLDKLLARKSKLTPVEKALRAGDAKQAVRLLQSLITENPKYRAYYRKLKADICIDNGLIDIAESIYRAVLTEREQTWARMGLGKVLFYKRAYAEAESMFQSLVLDNGQNVLARDWLAKCLVELGNHKTAQECLEQAIRISPRTVTRQKQLAELAEKNNDLEAAERAYKQAIKLGKHSVHKSPTVYASLARTLSSQGRHVDAMQSVGQLKKDFPVDPQAAIYAEMAEGMVHFRKGDTKIAQEKLGKALNDTRGLGLRAEPELMIHLAKSMADSEQPEIAAELLKEVAENNHDNKDILQSVAHAFVDTGLDPKGDDLVNRLCDNIVKLNNQGVRLVSAGQLDEAASIFREAVKRLPGNKIIVANTARVLIMSMQKNGVDQDTLLETSKLIESARTLDAQYPPLKRLLHMFQELLR